MYLLDTNVLSETIRKKPDSNVIAWLKTIDIDHLFISVITLGEIRKGIEKMDDSFKKQTIIQWLEKDLAHAFHGRFVSIDASVADKWGYLCGSYQMPAIDALIASCALVHNLKLVTRNVEDFQMINGIELMNPWKSA